MFDLTKEIKLAPKLHKKYLVARLFLHVIFGFAAIFVMYRILFPIVPLDFSMSSPNSSKNSLASPRISPNWQFPEKRLVKANEQFIFNANPVGEFSKISVEFSLDKNEKDISESPIKIQKSYRAFFYPTGKPKGFKSGDLLTTPDGSYYIVSNGLLRKFVNTDTILQLGYPKSAFIQVSQDDLQYNEKGGTITDKNNYPDDTLFVIDENYYQLKNQKLSPFISARAFTSFFDPAGAIAKNSDFLSRYQLTETYLGFADGSLVSSADSVFIISEGKSYPVENAETFLAMGFDFNNVLQLTQDEINAHTKQKQFTHNDPHPNGVVFFDRKANKYFAVENGTKRPFETEKVAGSYLKQKPVIADSEEILLESSCKLTKKLFPSNTYSCSTTLQNLTAAIGNDYQITTIFSNDAKLKSIRTTFSTPLKVESLKSSLAKIKERILRK